MHSSCHLPVDALHYSHPSPFSFYSCSVQSLQHFTLQTMIIHSSLFMISSFFVTLTTIVCLFSHIALQRTTHKIMPEALFCVFHLLPSNFHVHAFRSHYACIRMSWADTFWLIQLISVGTNRAICFNRGNIKALSWDRKCSSSQSKLVFMSFTACPA